MYQYSSALLQAVESMLPPSPDMADAVLGGSVAKYWTVDDRVQVADQREQSAINAMMCLRTDPSSVAELKSINKFFKTEETKNDIPLALPVDYKEKCLPDAISESDEDLDEEPECDDGPSEGSQNSDSESDEEIVDKIEESFPAANDNENENDINVPTPGPTFPPHLNPSCLPVSCGYEKKRKRSTVSLDNQSPIKEYSIGDNHEDFVEQNAEDLNSPTDDNAAAAPLEQEGENYLIKENFSLLLRAYEILQMSHFNHLESCNTEKAQMSEEIQALSEKNEILLSSLNQAQQETKDNRKQCSDLRKKIENLTQEVNKKNSYIKFLIKQHETTFAFVQQELHQW